MPFTPEDARRLNKELLEKFHVMELFSVRQKIDQLLQSSPDGTNVDSTKRVLDILQPEYETLGWYCRQYTKSYFHMELNHLEISATPFENPWKERILNFLSNL